MLSSDLNCLMELVGICFSGGNRIIELGQSSIDGCQSLSCTSSSARTQNTKYVCMYVCRSYVPVYTCTLCLHTLFTTGTQVQNRTSFLLIYRCYGRYGSMDGDQNSSKQPRRQSSVAVYLVYLSTRTANAHFAAYSSLFVLQHIASFYSTIFTLLVLSTT